MKNEDKANQFFADRVIDCIELMKSSVPKIMKAWDKKVKYCSLSIVIKAKKTLLDNLKVAEKELRGKNRKAYNTIYTQQSIFLNLLQTECERYCKEQNTLNVPNIVYLNYCDQIIKSINAQTEKVDSAA